MIRFAEDASESASLRQRVGVTVRQWILAGKLKPGNRIAQQRLAKQLSASQSVIREALLELQFTGLVESIANLGTFVADADRAKVLQAYQVREMLEGLAARLACDTASVVNIRELQGIAEKCYELGIANHDRERAEMDRRFHDYIFDISNNAVLQRVAGAYHIVRMVVLKNNPHEQVRTDHLQIIDAIRRNDPDSAERFARQHVISAREMIERQIASEGFELAGESALASSAD